AKEKRQPYTYSNLEPWGPKDPRRAPNSRSSSRGRQGSGGGLGERLDDAVHDLLDEPFVIALAHHPDHRFGARGAYDQAAVAIKARFGRLDGGPDAGVFERLAALVTHVLEHLRQRIETVTHLRHRQVLLLHHGKELERRDAPVAGGGEIG